MIYFLILVISLYIFYLKIESFQSLFLKNVKEKFNNYETHNLSNYFKVNSSFNLENVDKSLGVKIIMPLKSKLKLGLTDNSNFIVISNILQKKIFIRNQIESNLIDLLEKCKKKDIDMVLTYENLLLSKQPDNLRFMCGFNYDYFIFYVSKDVLFDNFKKIKMNGPLKIGLKTKNGYDHLCFIQILNTYNIKFKNNDSKQKINGFHIQFFFDNEKALNEKMLFGKLDGIFKITGINNIYIEEIVKNMPIRFIELNYKDFENNNLLKYNYKKNYDTNIFYGIISKFNLINTIASRIILVTYKDNDYNKIYNIIEQIYDNIFYLKEELTQIDESIYNYILFNKILSPSEMCFIEKKINFHKAVRDFYIKKKLIEIK